MYSYLIALAFRDFWGQEGELLALMPPNQILPTVLKNKTVEGRTKAENLAGPISPRLSKHIRNTIST